MTTRRRRANGLTKFEQATREPGAGRPEKKSGGRWNV